MTIIDLEQEEMLAEVFLECDGEVYYESDQDHIDAIEKDLEMRYWDYVESMCFEVQTSTTK